MAENRISAAQKAMERAAQQHQRAQQTLDGLLTDPQALVDRTTLSGVEGMFGAMALRHRYASLPMGIVEDMRVAQYIQLLTLRGVDTTLPDLPQRLAMRVSSLRQDWNAMSQEDTLAAVSLQDRMNSLPTAADTFGISQDEARQVTERFARLTAPAPHSQ